MTTVRWARLKGLFDRAIACPSDERAAFVAGACGDDLLLRGELEALVASDAAAGPFLEDPTGGVSWRDPPAPDLSGAALGAYRLVRRLGHGGMGEVYLATRAHEAYERQVAIKLLRTDGLDALARQRFREEHEILARLEHPNIARLLDGGTTEDGRPFLVMDYVDGQRIDRYCDLHRLGVTARLVLFRTVCAAVEYAHQHLVVHRDLKPANILVAADGTPKLLDFGIAKLLGSPATGMDATLTAVHPLTPEYASPEQVRGDVVTTASDVYSLGVLLYELMSGHSPYRMAGRPSYELFSAICEEQPLRPSQAVSVTETLRFQETAVTLTPESISRVREGRPDALRRRLEDDLDTVILTALRKEPGRRYRSVEQLSGDLGRHLGGLPVAARGDAVRYRLGKFMRRHRAGVAAAVLLVASLAGGLAATLWQAREASQAHARSERRFQQVRALANGFLFEFHDAIADLPGSTAARALVVRRATEYLDSLAQEARGDPGLQRELAAAYARLGAVQGGAVGASLGDTEGALASFGKALALREALAARPAAGAADVAALAEVRSDLAACHAKAGELAAAENGYGAALAELDRAHTLDPQADLRQRRVDTYRRLAWVQRARDRDPEALEALRKAADIGEAFCRDHPQDARARANLAGAYGQLSDALQAGGDAVGALQTSRQGTEALEMLVAAEPLQSRYTRDLIPALAAQGHLLKEVLHDVPAAVRVQSRALELAEGQVARDPRDAYAKVSAALTRHSLGFTLVEAGQTAAGLAAVRRAAADLEQAVTADPGNAFAATQLAGSYFDLGVLLPRVRPVADRERCHALARARTLYERMQASGRDTARVGELLSEVKTALAACPGTS